MLHRCSRLLAPDLIPAQWHNWASLRNTAKQYASLRSAMCARSQGSHLLLSLLRVPLMILWNYSFFNKLFIYCLQYEHFHSNVKALSAFWQKRKLNFLSTAKFPHIRRRTLPPR